MQVGVDGGHGRAGMGEQALDHVLWHPCVDQPGSQRVPELVDGDLDCASGFVVQADSLLPADERFS